MLELKNISFSVTTPEGRNDIIKDISLTVEDGKLLVLTGPNGGGKTTLAKIIMGLVTPTSGQILWNGEDITNLNITERLQTHGQQFAESNMEIILDGEDIKGRVISRSVAQDTSVQIFYPKMTGNAQCFGHVQCDSIIMDKAKISSIPAIVANSTEAELIHEAAIGKIAGDQLLKLETLGLSAEEAEERILKGFLA